MEVRPSLPISLGKGLRPVKRVLVKRLRIGVDMTLLIPGFKIGIASELADPPQVEFQGPLFQLGHRHSLEHRFRRFSESAGTQSRLTTGKPALWASCATAEAVYEMTRRSIPPL